MDPIQTVLWPPVAGSSKGRFRWFGVLISSLFNDLPLADLVPIDCMLMLQRSAGVYTPLFAIWSSNMSAQLLWIVGDSRWGYSWWQCGRYFSGLKPVVALLSFPRHCELIVQRWLNPEQTTLPLPRLTLTQRFTYFLMALACWGIGPVYYVCFVLVLYLIILITHKPRIMLLLLAGTESNERGQDWINYSNSLQYCITVKWLT